jgi:hypothetical protein
MLHMGKEQMRALENSAQADFHQRLVKFLRQELSQETAAFADTALLERISTSERRAATYGIETDAGIAQFVCLTFVAGPTFDEIPEVRDYLQEPGMDPEEKLDELVEYLTALEAEGSLG